MGQFAPTPPANKVKLISAAQKGVSIPDSYGSSVSEDTCPQVFTSTVVIDHQVLAFIFLRQPAPLILKVEFKIDRKFQLQPPNITSTFKVCF